MLLCDKCYITLHYHPREDCIFILRPRSVLRAACPLFLEGCRFCVSAGQLNDRTSRPWHMNSNDTHHLKFSACDLHSYILCVLPILRPAHLPACFLFALESSIRTQPLGMSHRRVKAVGFDDDYEDDDYEEYEEEEGGEGGSGMDWPSYYCSTKLTEVQKSSVLKTKVRLRHCHVIDKA
jgi:hypothetical protein